VPGRATIPALQAVRLARQGGAMTRTTELKPDVKRHRRIAATVYVVVFVALVVLVAWRLVSPVAS
jgi:hypothetical protein